MATQILWVLCKESDTVGVAKDKFQQREGGQKIANTLVRARIKTDLAPHILDKQLHY